MHVATEDQHDENKAPPSLSDRGAARRRLIRAGAAGAGVLLTLESRGALASPVCATPSGSLSGGLNNSNYGQQTCSGGFAPEHWASKSVSWPSGLDRNTLAFTTIFPMGSQCQMMPAPAVNNNGNANGIGNGNGNANGHGNANGNGKGNTNGNGNPNGNGNGNGNGKGNTNANGVTMVPVPSYQCALMDEVLTRQSYDANELGMYMAATYLNIRANYVTFLTPEALQEIWVEVSTSGVYRPTAGVIWSREELKDYFKSTMNGV
jgi:hypothetical protein